MRKVLLLGAVASLLTVTGCRALRGSFYSLENDKTVCPEYRDLMCMSAVECSMDEKRGCRVCQCSPADAPAKPQPDDRTY